MAYYSPFLLSMIYIEKPGTDPWFNIAAEEFATKQLTEDVLMLWESDWCVVTGKHQLAYAEINPSEVFISKTPVIRRISGGGTVVHAPGNLNFSFITDNSNSDSKIDFRKATRPIVDFLSQFGLKVELSRISNLSVNNLKISGNAAHVYKNRSLHHGTLLYNTDIRKLASLISRKDMPYASKAIKSNPTDIVNIATVTGSSLSYPEFKLELQKYLFNVLQINSIRIFSSAEAAAIQRLIDEKYKQDWWNYGYSPDYTFEKVIGFAGYDFAVAFAVRKGTIYAFKITGSELLQPLATMLIGVQHSWNEIEEKISSSAFSSIFSKQEINQLVVQLI